jgi:hypothetical protein
LAVGNADPESVGSRGFVAIGGGASDESAGTPGIKNSFFGNRMN